MATVDKTWTFASDNEGLADNGDTANFNVAHDTGGNPGGSLEFLTGASVTNGTERARKATTGESWETWGVPSSSTVTDVQLISYDKRLWSGGVGPRIRIRVLDSGGTTVHSAGDLEDTTFGTTAGWTSQGAGTSRAVDSGSQASTTDVRLEVQASFTGTEASWDLGVDNIKIRMTYTTGGGGGTTVKQLAALGVG